MDRMPEEERLAGYHLLFRHLKVTEKTNISYLQKLQWRIVCAQNGYFENAVLCVPMDNLCQTLTVPLKLPRSREIPWNIFVLTLYKLKNQIQRKKIMALLRKEKKHNKEVIFRVSLCISKSSCSLHYFSSRWRQEYSLFISDSVNQSFNRFVQKPLMSVA